MKIGEVGERAAQRFLERQNYKIIECNYRCKAGEIDIIAESSSIIAFIEVKTRSSLQYGRPSEAITRTKQNHLLWAAHWFITAKGDIYPAEEYRFDVIEVLLHDNQKYINHIKNAF